MSPFLKLTIRTVFNYFARTGLGRFPGKRQTLLFGFLKIFFGMGLQLGMSPFWKLTIRTVFNYFARARFGKLPGKRQTLLLGFLKIFLVWAWSWACHHFWNWPFEHFFIISREHVLGEFLENVKHYCLCFWKYFWYGLAVGHVTIFNFFPPPNLLSRSHDRVKWLLW